MIMYSVYDVKAGVYTQPFFDLADGSAERQFKNTVGNAEHPFGRNPEDYSLCRIGGFDDANAKVINEDTEVLITGLKRWRRGE